MNKFIRVLPIMNRKGKQYLKAWHFLGNLKNLYVSHPILRSRALSSSHDGFTLPFPSFLSFSCS